MDLSTREQGRSLIFDLIGPLDMEGAALLKERLRSSLNSGVAQVVLNLEQVPSMDSSGLGALVTMHLAYQERGASLIAYGASAAVRIVLVATNLEEFILLFDTEQQALSMLE